MKRLLIYFLLSVPFYLSCENNTNDHKSDLQVNDSARILPQADINHDSMGASTLGTTGVIWSTTGSTTTSQVSPNDVTAGSTPLTVPNASSEKDTAKSGSNLTQ